MTIRCILVVVIVDAATWLFPCSIREIKSLEDLLSTLTLILSPSTTHASD
jgi:hypothetical protein